MEHFEQQQKRNTQNRQKCNHPAASLKSQCANYGRGNWLLGAAGGGCGAILKWRHSRSPFG